MRSKRINISEEKVSQLTEVLNKNTKIHLGYISIKKISKYQFWCSSACDIAESKINMVDVAKSRMEDLRQKRLISIEISFHALIKKNNDKSFGHVMQKIRNN